MHPGENASQSAMESAWVWYSKTMNPKPPIARKQPTEKSLHGHTLHDDYAWLRQDNWQAMFADTSLLQSDIRDYLLAENAYTAQSLTTPNTALIDTLVDEIKQRTEIFYDSAPERNKNFEYFRRYTDSEYPIYLRRDLTTGAEQLLLDVNAELSKDGQKVFLHDVQHSPDNKYLAIIVDFSGSENYQLLLKDLDTGELSSDKIERIGDIEWGADSASLYYTRYSDNPDEYRIDRIFRHVIGANPEDDTLLFSSTATNFFLRISKTDSGRFLVIKVSNSKAVELHILDMELPGAKPICLAGREQKILYDIEHIGPHLYIRTNKDDAVDFKIQRADIANPTREFWQDYQPHQPGCLIRGIKALQNHLVQLQMKNALPQIAVTNLHDDSTHLISFEEKSYALSLGNCAGFDSTCLRFGISSPRLPLQEFDYDLNSRERVLVRQENIPSHTPDDYILERVSVPGHDHAEIPLTIIRHKDTSLDGSAPVRLYAYGSYGSIIPSDFERYNKAYPLLDRGFIFAEAHIRGGADCGYQWYLDGKLGSKKNSFHDYIACAQWLVSQNYTAPGLIAAEGRSAGGLLMGAVANLAPTGLFGCMIAEVPFIDLMNTIMDESLPLTPPEWDEWGNPLTDKEAFEYMLSYSPYDNVTTKAYPAMFITGGLTDPRVTYWEPAKWVAKLRDLKTGDNPIYLHIDMDAGHRGDPGRFGTVFETARKYAFMLQSLSPLRTH
jgi:oligopeptidase B